MKIRFLIFLCSFLMAGCASRPPVVQEVAPGPYVCRPAGTAIVVDGRLDESAWQHAETLAIRYVFKPEKYTVPPPETTVRLLWDRDYLYVGFTCIDDDIWSFSSRADDTLWSGDVAELFLKPSREAKNYYEFIVAPNGALYDTRYPSRGAGGSNRFKSWSSGARIATGVKGTDGNCEDSDQGYCVEMAIPWAAFSEGRPAENSIWTFGAFRYDYSKSLEDPFLLTSMPGPLTWFHNYEKYQDIRFSSDVP
jgi:hypothetical protein